MSGNIVNLSGSNGGSIVEGSQAQRGSRTYTKRDAFRGFFRGDTTAMQGGWRAITNTVSSALANQVDRNQAPERGLAGRQVQPQQTVYISNEEVDEWSFVEELSASSSSSPVASDSSLPEDEPRVHPENYARVRSFSCSQEDKNKVVSKIDQLIALRQELVSPTSREKEREINRGCRSRIRKNDLSIQQLKEERKELEKTRWTQSRRPIQLQPSLGQVGRQSLLVLPNNEEMIITINERIQERQNKIRQLEEENERLISSINGPQEQYLSIIAELGDSFELDLNRAIELHEKEIPFHPLPDSSGESVPDELADSTLEALKSMKELLTQEKDGEDKSIFRQRRDFYMDFFRSVLAFRTEEGYFLASQSDYPVGNFQKIEEESQINPNPEKNLGINYHYQYEDMLEGALESGKVQRPEKQNIEAGSQGQWVMPYFEKFLDEQGVSLVERYRIYREGHQGAVVPCLEGKIRNRQNEHLKRAMDKSLSLKERATEYCRANYEAELNIPYPPSQLTDEQGNLFDFGERFIQYFEDIDFSNMRGQVTSSRMCVLDLHNKCIVTHYAVSYSDPRVFSYNDGNEGGYIEPGEKRIVHYYIHYDYANDKRTIREGEGFVPTARDENGVFPQLTTNNIKENEAIPPFPHPAHVYGLPKFPLADYAGSGQAPNPSDKGKEPAS